MAKAGDPWGAAQSLAAAVADAELYEISPDVLDAARRLSAQPASVLLALRDRVRPPHPATWIEWTPRGSSADPGRPVPRRVGVLVEAAKEELHRQRWTLAWCHAPGEVVVGAVGIEADFRPVADLWHEAESVAKKILTPELMAQVAECWRSVEIAQLRAVPREEAAATSELLCRMLPGPTRHVMGAWKFCAAVDRLREMLELGMADLAGEPRLTIALLALLNEPGAVAAVREDLSQINRRRTRRGRPPLREFYATMLASDPEGGR